MIKDITLKQFNKGLIEIYANNTSCNIQHKGCPCNSCFHSQEADFKHINWLIVLALRGDYNKREILIEIQKELTKNKRISILKEVV